VSKSSFLLLLFSVASLSAAAGIRSGGVRWGRSTGSVKFEAGAGMESLKDEVEELRDQIMQLPRTTRDLLDDLRKDLEYLGADARVDARMAGHYLSTLI